MKTLMLYKIDAYSNCNLTTVSNLTFSESKVHLLQSVKSQANCTVIVVMLLYIVMLFLKQNVIDNEKNTFQK